MKKYLALILMAVLLCCVGVAAAQPEGYPEIRIDPATGKPYDFGGRTMYILDYWSGDGARAEEPTEAQQAAYDYQDWLMSTYNVKIRCMQGGDWSTCAEEMRNFVNDPDDTLRVYIIEPGKVGNLVSSGNAADWSRSDTVDTADGYWNQGTVKNMTVGASVYGVSSGATEPRQVIFFNKRLLEEAGIDWNRLYDLQKSGDWTWSEFEKALAAVHRDLDNDGVVDVYGISGSSDDLYRMSVFSNGGEFFTISELGEMKPAMDSEATKAGLAWAQKIYRNYWKETPQGANWDWYKTAWKEGEFAFYMYQAFGGFNTYSEMSGMADEWGCLVFPKGPGSKKYLSISSENTALIPNVYTDKEISMISLMYQLWTLPTPGYENEDSWIGDKLNFTDERAVFETYAMLRESDYQVNDYTSWLGSVNDVLGVRLLWSLAGAEADELIQEGTPAWQEMCDNLNSGMKGYYDVSLDLSGYTLIELPAELTGLGSEALLGHGGEVLEISENCTSIGSRAFAEAPNLKYVIIPGGVSGISNDAFDDCPTGMVALVMRGSYAAEFCEDNGINYLYMSTKRSNYTPRGLTLELGQ